jgi:hypothetical protein
MMRLGVAQKDTSKDMDTANNKTTLSWWRIALATIVAVIISLYVVLLLSNLHINAYSRFLTDFLRLSGAFGNAVGSLILFAIPLLFGFLSGAAFGCKPRWLHGLVTSIIVFLIQIGIWLFFVWAFAKFQ